MIFEGCDMPAVGLCSKNSHVNPQVNPLRENSKAIHLMDSFHRHLAENIEEKKRGMNILGSIPGPGM